jgi:MarR family transcriptional regulator, 2-MHQ and catechol-resistance regulon repressor
MIANGRKAEAGMLDGISEGVVIFTPLLYKKLLNGGSHAQGRRASYLEVPILSMLIHRGPQPMSDIGRRLYISKPNMTTIVDKLISEGKACRLPDERDRRVTKIGITGMGRTYMREHWKTVKETVKSNISGLSGRDLRVLCESLDNMRIIISKIAEE